MYFVGKITQSRSLHLPKVWMGTRGLMLCVAFFVASQKRPWLGQLLRGSPSISFPGVCAPRVVLSPAS